MRSIYRHGCRRRRVAGTAALMLMLALAAGVWTLRDPAPTGPSPGIAAPEELARGLGLHGSHVRPAPIDESCTDSFLKRPGRRYEFDPQSNEGIERLCVYPYSGPGAAAGAAREVPPKADRALADWAADVRYFRCGAVIAQYLGGDRVKVGLLTALCGPPFYEAEGWGPGN
jgi:hypothetical protein